MHIKKFSIINSFGEAIILIGPHLLLELYWMVLIFQFSLKIQIWFTKLLNNEITPVGIKFNEFVYFSFALSLIFIAAFIEIKYSPLIFNYLIK